MGLKGPAFKNKRGLSGSIAVLLWLAGPAASQAEALPKVTVIATRTAAAPIDIAASVSRIGADDIQDGKLQVNISESLGAVQALLARDRQNYARDVQISVRGFGARSTFAIRGVHRYVDGIPATLPDGQGQISNADLGSAERIEVLRGAVSALHGNSAGGVIQLFTEDGQGPPTLSASSAADSNGIWREAAKLVGASGAGGYVLSVGQFNSDGYQNFIGTTLGVQGALRRDEQNDVRANDQYWQASWQFAKHWKLDLGLRHSVVNFTSTDAYIVGANKDDGGSVRYSATLPVLGLLFAVNGQLHLYATAGRGFETPTLNELAYCPDGTGGLNFGLQAARSRSVEAGVKLRPKGLGEFSAAAFQTRTDHEIVTLTNSGSRSTHQNAGGTERTGLELGWTVRWSEALSRQAELTLLNAPYADAFKTSTASPCTAPNVAMAAGNQMPGLARGSYFAALNWAPAAGWRAGLETQAVSHVAVNDVNSDAAPRYVVANASLGYATTVGSMDLSAFARAANLFDRRYAGSVIVNEGNSRFFDPAPGRNWLAGLNASASF